MKKYFFKWFGIIFILVLLPIVLIWCTSTVNNNEQNDSLVDENKTPTITTLAAPIPRWENNLIVWDTIKNATSYKLSINNKEFSTTDNFFNLGISDTPTEYAIKVKAIGNNKTYISSEYSQAINIQSKQLRAPYAAVSSIDHTFRLSSDTTSSGSMILTFPDETDFINLYVNDVLYVCDYESNLIIKHNDLHNHIELIINSSMCKAGENELKIQACSYNALYLDGVFLTTKVYKNFPLNNVKVKDGKIEFGSSGMVYSEKYYSNCGFGNVTIPVINHGDYYSDYLDSDPVYIDVYRIRPLNISRVEYKLNQNTYEYECSALLNNDTTYSSTSSGFDYNKLEIIIYVGTFNENYYIQILDVGNLHINNHLKSIDFSVDALMVINKITFRLYNSEHPEYVSSIKTIQVLQL